MVIAEWAGGVAVRGQFDQRVDREGDAAPAETSRGTWSQSRTPPPVTFGDERVLQLLRCSSVSGSEKQGSSLTARARRDDLTLVRPDHEQALVDIEQLLAKVPNSAADVAAADTNERVAELKVLERVVELLAPQFDGLADIIIVRREEFSSEFQPSLNQFHREDYPENGVLIHEHEGEDGTGKLGRLRLWGTRIYLLKDQRLLLVQREGFREERKRRGMRPDRQEVWAATTNEVTPAEALERIALIEMVLDTVKEQVEMSVGLAEDHLLTSAERTAKLLRLVDGMN